MVVEAVGPSEHLDDRVVLADEIASRLDAVPLQTQTTELSISGAGRADVDVSESLKVAISGAGKVVYSGNPKRVEKDISGAGSIKPRE